MSIIVTILCGIFVAIIYIARYNPEEEFKIGDKVCYQLSDDNSKYTGVITARLTYIKESMTNDTSSKVVRRQTNNEIEKNVIILYEVRPDLEGDTFLLSNKHLTKITDKEYFELNITQKYEDKRKHKKAKK